MRPSAIEVAKTLQTFSLSCILDAKPRFYVEFILWIICATRHLSETFALRPHIMEGVPTDLLDWCESRGIQWVRTKEVVEGSPHSNKIAPFLTHHHEDRIVVCDTDLYFVRDPAPLLRSSRVRAPPNNGCNPPPHIFKRIIYASGLQRSYRPGLALFDGAEGMRETHINNISAGIVVIPGALAPDFGRLWIKWARWLVENRHLLEAWWIHVDQVAFALAMEELGEDVEFLPAQVNTVLNLLPHVATLYALHLTTGHIPSHKSLFRDDRTMVASGLRPEVGDDIHRLNDAIVEATDVIKRLPSTRDHMDKFLNPNWLR